MTTSVIVSRSRAFVPHFGAPKHVGACLAIWLDLAAGRSREGEPPPPSVRERSLLPAAATKPRQRVCVRLVGSTRTWKKKVVVRARPTRTPGLLNFPPPSSAQWPSGSRAHGWTRLRPKISLAEEGASDLCFAHKLPAAYARAHTLLPVCGSRRKHKRRGELLPADRRLLISPLK